MQATPATSADKTQAYLAIDPLIEMALISGVHDSLIRLIEKHTATLITLRGNEVIVEGEAQSVALAVETIHELEALAKSGQVPEKGDIDRILAVQQDGQFSPRDLKDDILLTHRGRPIRPKTPGQKRYVDAIRNNTVTFGLGPAGTGKTYLAMAMAVSALKKKEVSRIVLCRPVVEAGESLGFLPGTLEEKVDPYVRPLYDALYDMTDREKGAAYIETGTIEIAPLAFMRGRTLNDAFVILDEAQNTTPEQMKMFLTRLGFNSTFVITGDASQTDLAGKPSGLSQIEATLSGIDDITFIHLTRKDVVRHSLVGKIVEAYEKGGH